MRSEREGAPDAADGRLAEPAWPWPCRGWTSAWPPPAGSPACASAPAPLAGRSACAEFQDAARPADRRDPESRNRCRHLPAVGSEQPCRRAISVLLNPSAASSTIRERSARACAVFARRDQDCNCSRCSAPRVNGTKEALRRWLVCGLQVGGLVGGVFFSDRSPKSVVLLLDSVPCEAVCQASGHTTPRAGPAVCGGGIS